MIRVLRLLLPALLPSWRFFDVIAPSPRIHYQILNEKQQPLVDWLEFRPRPAHVSALHMVRRLLANARWNETLYLVSCAERIAQDGRTHSENEILDRIARELQGDPAGSRGDAHYVHFRLLFVHREHQQLVQQIYFTSRIARLADSLQ